MPICNVSSQDGLYCFSVAEFGAGIMSLYLQLHLGNPFL